MTRNLLAWILILGLAFGCAAGAAYATRSTWRPWLTRTTASPPTNDPPADGHDHDGHDHCCEDLVVLTPQARDNLQLRTGPPRLGSYWQTLEVPGSIVERPGTSDRGITAPVAGVVTRVHAYPGDLVRPGDSLFTLRLSSEYIQNVQAELAKATQEIQLLHEQAARLKDASRSGAIPEARMVDLANQERRLAGQVRSMRQDLSARGLTSAQIDSASQGRLVTELTIPTPGPVPDNPGDPAPPDAPPDAPASAFEVQDMKVQLGEQVQAGQLLGLLANHYRLLIEGRAFKKEAAVLERAAVAGQDVEVDIADDDAAAWPPLNQQFRIRHLANSIDTSSRTFGFYIPLANQARSYTKDGRPFLVWRFRPGQRVRLHVPVREFKDVLILPAEAVTRDGPDVLAFAEEGDGFERKPVHVLYQDRRDVVLAKDGGLSPADTVALNASAALNRIYKARQAARAGDSAHDHDHGHAH